MDVSLTLSNRVNLLRTTPRFVNPIVTVVNTQPAYITYKGLLPAYMSAGITQQRTSVHAPGYSIKDYAGPLIPLVMPSIAVSFSGAVPSELMDKMKSVGVLETTIQKAKIFIIKDCPSGLTKELKNNGGIETCPSPQQTVNISSIPEITFLRKLISLFLSVHTYPAFDNLDQLADLQALELVGDGSSTTGKRKRDGVIYEDAPLKNLQRPQEEDDDGDDDQDVSMDPQTTDSARDGIKVALPPLLTPQWGDVEGIPKRHGVFIPFLAELSDFDAKTIPEVVNTYFLRSLGTSHDIIVSKMDDIRRACGIMSDTDLGKEWSHMMRCIAIALNAQAVCYAIYSDEVYTGCVISGCGFTISVYGLKYQPVPFDELVKLVERSNPHASTVSAIAELLPSMSASKQAEWDAIDSMIDLRVFLWKSKITESVKDDILRLSKHLRYPQKTWPLTVEHLEKALRYIREASVEELPQDITLHASMLFEKDIVSCIWSTFGAMAPTCVFSGGPMTDLTSASSSSGPIAWKSAVLPEAIRTIQSLIREKKFPRGQGGRRSTNFKDRMFTGAQATRVWVALRSAAGVDVSGKVKVPGSSRAVVVEEDYDY